MLYQNSTLYKALYYKAALGYYSVCFSYRVYCLLDTYCAYYIMALKCK